MMKLRWIVALTALTLFLTACPEVEPKTATLELTASPNPVPAGGEAVALTATVTAGAENVASVDFAVKDAASALGTDSDTADNVYNFTTLTSVTAATTFVATARDSGGAAIGSDEVEVTVSAPDIVTVTLTASPNPLPVGGGNVTLTATITSGAARVKSVAFSIKGQTAVLNTDTTAPYSFTTTTPITVATTFVATAKDAATGGTTLDTDEVAVTVTPGTTIPAGATKAATLAEILAAPSDPPGGATVPEATIAVTADITCTADDDPCIPLKVGQRLVGANAAGTVVAVRKITANGTVADPITVLELANNTTVESFDIAGTGIFRSISAPSGLTGTVTINDVDVDMTASTSATFGSPVQLGGGEPDPNPDVADPTPATFSVDGVDITGMTTGKSGIEVYGVASLAIINSSVSRTAAAPATADPGVFIVGHTSTISLDNLRVTANSGPGISIFKRAPAPAATVKDMKVTIKNTNTQITPPAGEVGIKLTGTNSGAALPPGEKMIIQAGSAGNISNAATKVDANSFVVTGVPTFNP